MRGSMILYRMSTMTFAMMTRAAITNRDYTMIMGTTILLAALVIIANVIVDILYKIIDPRIKLK